MQFRLTKKIQLLKMRTKETEWIPLSFLNPFLKMAFSQLEP